ncbi:MAG: type IV pilus modification protein PilV [Pseudomonadota bacterium]
MSASRNQSGFSLMEVLVAVLIMSVGLLGLAGLQMLSVKQTSEADRASIAMLHANTIAENYRADDGDWYESTMTQIVKRDLSPEATVSLTEDGDLAEVEIRWPSSREGSGENAEMKSVQVYTRSQ